FLRLQRGRLGDRAGELREARAREAPALLRVQLVHRLEERLFRPATANGIGQCLEPLRNLVEEDVLLRGEVVEDRLLRDVCLARDLADGNVVEAARDEETHPGGRDRPACLQLL